MSANPETGVFPEGDLDPDVASDEFDDCEEDDGDIIWTEEDQQNLYEQNEERERLR